MRTSLLGGSRDAMAAEDSSRRRLSHQSYRYAAFHDAQVHVEAIRRTPSAPGLFSQNQLGSSEGFLALTLSLGHLKHSGRKS